MPRNGDERGILSIALESRPHSTMSRLVFPWDQLSNTYSKHEFNPIATQGVIEEEDIDRVLNSLKTTKNYVPKRSLCLCFGIFLTFVLYISFIFILIITGKKSDNKDGRRNGGRGDGGRGNPEEDASILPALFVIGGIALFFISIICLGHKMEKKFKEMLEQRRNEFDEILTNFNEGEFRAKDVEWKVGNYGAWITLELNYILRNNIIARGINPGNIDNFSTGLPILQTNVDIDPFQPKKLQAKI